MPRFTETLAEGLHIERSWKHQYKINEIEEWFLSIGRPVQVLRLLETDRAIWVELQADYAIISMVLPYWEK